MFETQFKLKGYLTLLKFDKTGRCVEETRIENLVVDQGLEYTSKLLNGISSDAFKYIAIGTNSTAAAISDTTLNTEEDRVLATTAYEASFKAKLTGTFNFTGNVTLREAGILDAASVGHLLSRVTFADKSFGAGESLAIVWTVELSRS